MADYVEYKEPLKATILQGSNIRVDCSTTADIITKTTERAEVVVYGFKLVGNGRWYKVKYKEYIGYTIKSNLIIIYDKLYGLYGNKSMVDILEVVYPVGSIYMSVNNVDPAKLFGGTWEKLKNRFLLGAGDTYTNGDTGGEATHTLIGAEMPAHTHGFSATTSSGGRHQHVTGYRRRDVYATGGNADAMIWSQETETVKSDFAGEHSHSVSGTTGATGSSQAHNNMPPYLVVNMWKRTA